MKDNMIKSIFFRACYIGMIVFLAACGGGGGDDQPTSAGTALPDVNPPPNVSIIFPSAKSYTDTPSISVRGTADEGAIASLSVNGIAATSENGFATWSATIPLEMGAQNIQVSVEDIAGEQFASAAQTEITYTGLLMSRPWLMELDKVNNQVFIVDTLFNALFSVDMDNGQIKLISDVSVPNADNIFERVEDMALDIDNNRLIVLDQNIPAVLSVDFDTGGRMIISGEGIPNADNPLFYPKDIALDVANNRALVLQSDNTLLSVDLSTGIRTVVYTSPGFNLFSTGAGMVYDPNNERVLILDYSNDRLVGINVNTGNFDVVSDVATPDNSSLMYDPVGLTLDLSGNRVVTTNHGSQELLAIDLATGARSVLLDLSALASELGNIYIPRLAWDEAQSQFLLLDGVGIDIVSMNLGGVMETISLQGEGLGNEFRVPERLVFDQPNNQLYVVDQALDAIKRIDLSDGSVNVLSDNATPNDANVFDDPFDIALDTENDRAIVSNRSAHTLLSVDLNTGERSVISDNTTPNSNNPFSWPNDIELDVENNRVVVVNGNPGSVYAVNLDSGERTVIVDSNSSSVFAANSTYAEGLAVDYSSNLAYLGGYGATIGILSVDIFTGETSMVSENDLFSEASNFTSPSGVLLDTDNNRLIVSDWTDLFFSVDLGSGERSIFSSATVPNSANRFGMTSGTAYDLDSDLLYVADRGVGAVFVIDMTNGHRVVLSH